MTFFSLIVYLPFCVHTDQPYTGSAPLWETPEERVLGPLFAVKFDGPKNKQTKKTLKS